jgi:hypothetical protein
MVMTSCSLVDGCRSFGATSCFIFNLEDGDTGYSETLITQSIITHNVINKRYQASFSSLCRTSKLSLNA